MPPGPTPAQPSARVRPGADDEFLPEQRDFRVPREPEKKLTSLEQRILEFEARWWRASGAKTQAVVDEFELTPEQYYQHLARLIDRPEAAAEQPAVIRRLRAARDRRRGVR